MLDMFKKCGQESPLIHANKTTSWFLSITIYTLAWETADGVVEIYIMMGICLIFLFLYFFILERNIFATIFLIFLFF